ncbi:uncharacterized protein METZ01_LOCUS130276 [marine metagenome]|uniref:arginine--tRNA ligase n=1 Tax=marine metagenome TaxID=408172 RepID=A0A381YLF2_9ZZZZ
MKELLVKLLNNALKNLEKIENIDLAKIKVEIKKNKQKDHGDYSTNLAMIIAKKLSKPPLEVAELLVKETIKDKSIQQIKIAEPGFINFFIQEDSYLEILKKINKEKENFGKIKPGSKEKILIEYVSSNPTGPLHVGHGRGAAFGSVLSNILRARGFCVDEEYYVNDRGRQTEILALSVWVRYIQIFENQIPFPKGCYQGNYIYEIAKEVHDLYGEKYILKNNLLIELSQALTDKNQEEDLDLLINLIRAKLKKKFLELSEFSLKFILEGIKEDLNCFGVKQNLWFKETSLFSKTRKDPSLMDKSMSKLEEGGFIYEKEGASWFRSSDFKDDKDRVVRRGNSQTTYFASDIAYHLNKYQRGYKKIINIWGADHHGYLPRVSAAIKALGEDVKKLDVVFIQFANLLREGEKISMSTRGGEFVTLKELMEEVTPEAARFFFINRKGEQHLDFDLDLAKKQNQENPLYYIQYAHARICSLFQKLNVEKKSYKERIAIENLNNLNDGLEIEMMKILSQYSEVIAKSAKNYEPHLICYYLRELASSFHSYYNNQKILVENPRELQPKLFMLFAIRQVIFNGLTILGISSPTSM